MSGVAATAWPCPTAGCSTQKPGQHQSLLQQLTAVARDQMKASAPFVGRVDHMTEHGAPRSGAETFGNESDACTFTRARMTTAEHRNPFTRGRTARVAPILWIFRDKRDKKSAAGAFCCAQRVSDSVCGEFTTRSAPWPCPTPDGSASPHTRLPLSFSSPPFRP
jgi:hypothetical protein